MVLTLLILQWLQSLAFPLHASTQHFNIKELSPLLLLYSFCSKLNYLAKASFCLGQSLAKCPAPLQQKHITSDKSRGFLFGQPLKKCPDSLHLKQVIWLKSFLESNLFLFLDFSVPIRASISYGSYSTSSVGNSTRSSFGQFWEMCPSSPHE